MDDAYDIVARVVITKLISSCVEKLGILLADLLHRNENNHRVRCRPAVVRQETCIANIG